MRRIVPALYLLVVVASLIVFSDVTLAESAFEPFTGRTVQAANMRQGPGTDYDVITVLPAGTLVHVVGCNETCDWYTLDTGGWTAAFLIDCFSTESAAPQVTAFPAGAVPAQVLSIKNAEIINVLLNGVEVPVRYIGVNAPGRGVALQEDATSFNAQLVEGETVYLERDLSDTDDDGRLLRYVWLVDGRMVNEAMIAEGFAAYTTDQTNLKYESSLLAAQQGARAERRNWWSFFPKPPP